MAEFCNCGSLMIGGNCTNKNCSNKVTAKPAAKAARAKGSKSSSTVSSSLKPKVESYQTRTRRASKCITYNLYDNNKTEETPIEEENQ